MKNNTTEFMEHKNILKYEHRFPNSTSKKKKWYYTIKCTKCNEITELVYAPKTSKTDLCQRCSRGLSDTKSFVEKAINVHGSKYDYSATIYKGSKQKVDIICKEHGIFTQRANDHLAGNNCSKCAVTARSADSYGEYHTVSTLQKCVDHLPLITVVDRLPKNEAILTCNLHGKFNIKQNSVVKAKGNLCPSCNRLEHQKVQY